MSVRSETLRGNNLFFTFGGRRMTEAAERGFSDEQIAKQNELVQDLKSRALGAGMGNIDLTGEDIIKGALAFGLEIQGEKREAYEKYRVELPGLGFRRTNNIRLEKTIRFYIGEIEGK